MDVFDMLSHVAVLASAFFVYFLIKKRSSARTNYTDPDWSYPLKWAFAYYYAVKSWKSGRKQTSEDELPRTDLSFGWDTFSIRETTPDGAVLLLDLRKLAGKKPLAEVALYLKMVDGTIYVLPNNPTSEPWENTEEAWSAGGLKIQVLKPKQRVRILFNGVLTRTQDGVQQHVTLNYLWTSGSSISRFPGDWSSNLAAHAVALETWGSDDCSKILDKWDEESWLQWGVIQGRFQAFDEEGTLEKTEFSRFRGVRERRTAPRGFQGLRRDVNISVIAKDGSAVQLRALEYNGVETKSVSGCVRHPDSNIQSIVSTDFSIKGFKDSDNEIPKIFTFTVETKSRQFRAVLTVNKEVELLNGTSEIGYQRAKYYSLSGVINGYPATGFLQRGDYTEESDEVREQLPSGRKLRWLTPAEIGPAGYCVRFDEPAAACPDYVGGKGASLALLTSVQDEQGYKVPPGFCLTTKALEKHLEMNPQIISAIQNIKAANENYTEDNFKSKCNKASQLLVDTPLTGDVRQAILSQMVTLRQRASQQRFAVRSSAVGEDSETLSAAGQNETFLGCVSDDDVLKAVQKCWASMFAFTSAYYRRQNGQTCLCGGGVVVQAMAPARAAGVMFSRHPDHGDPRRLLITANYGLGESVVSGSVEPDTVIVKRHPDGKLTIMTTELGSKTASITTTADGVTSQAVSESDRGKLCLSEAEILRLARIGVNQEQLWGAGRDIEWAVANDGIYLLQARPITSLERWTPEELLHEFDTPIMSDDDLVTFANCGEVMPKPVSPMGYSLLVRAMNDCILKIGGISMGEYEKGMMVTHHRIAMAMYNISYRVVPKTLTNNVRMQEMSLHGHPVADQKVLDTAIHRRPPNPLEQIYMMFKNMIWALLSSKLQVILAERAVKNLPRETINKEPMEIVDQITGLHEAIIDISGRHLATSSASTVSQMIAMSILLEGSDSEFTPQQCTEIGTMLSAGDVLSVEVPLRLAQLARQIHASGKMDEFRAQQPETAMEWLKKTVPDIHKSVLQFLEEHGCRGIMEFDVATKPWVLAPGQLMQIVSSMNAAEEVRVATKTDAELVASLKTPKKESTRKYLSWLLPICRHMVRNRECTKSQVILAVHKLRLILIELGKLLVKEWYLPDPDLVFFFRVEELKKYIGTRDPVLLRKAVQRHQLFPSWAKLKFPEVMTGWPEPLQVAGPSVSSGDVKIKATSIFGGEVIARACVVKDLSEIHQLKQGDVLVTHATDIGWSPYFPLLSGIVTELGGLISHGAVIAREYGLPCIVGATGATDIFKTGDTVRLLGSEGILEKVVVLEKINDS